MLVSCVMLSTGYVFSTEGLIKFDDQGWSNSLDGYLLNSDNIGKKITNFSFKRENAVAYWSN